VKGNQALIIAEGTIKSVKIGALTATASMCNAEEVDARRIKCGVTFADLKEWGLDTALCTQVTCVGTGAAI